MDSEIDRFSALNSSSLSKCRQAQFSLHFRAELAEFNVLGTGLNPVALKFKCKNALKKKCKTGIVEKRIFSSAWRIRHPEMRPGGLIAVPILYEGDWSPASVISIVFIIHNKKKQRIAYSKGEVVLVDDVLEERFAILMTPRDEKSTDDLKQPVLVHLFVDVWDADAGLVRIRRIKQQAPNDEQKTGEKNRIVFQRTESVVTNESDECAWPESTDFLIEIPLQSTESSPIRRESCDFVDRCTFDENANLVKERSSTPNATVAQQRCVQFFCHQWKLARESGIFKEMFAGDWTKDANALKFRSFTPSSIEIFLNFIYSNQLHSTDTRNRGDALSRISFEQIIEVVALAKRYEVHRLKSYCDALLTDRYLNLPCAAESILIAERYELPILGQAALSLLSWSLDDEYWQPLFNEEAKHLLKEVIRESRRKHMFCTIVNSSQ